MGPFALDDSVTKSLPLATRLEEKRRQKPETRESGNTIRSNQDAVNWFEVAFTVIGVNIIAIGTFWWLRKCYFRKEDSELLVLDAAV